MAKKKVAKKKSARKKVAASKTKVLTEKAARKLVKAYHDCRRQADPDDNFLNASEYTEIVSAAAEVLRKNRSNDAYGYDECPYLILDGLTDLSDAAAKSLGKYRGPLSLDGLTSLSDAASASLSRNMPLPDPFYERLLSLNGVTSLSDAAGEAFSKYKGELHLDGLTSLSDAAAESLSLHDGSLDLYGLTKLSAAATESLSKYNGVLNGSAGLSRRLNKFRADRQRQR